MIVLMDKHALEVLEFEKIKAQLKEYITSKLTKTFIDRLSPKTDIDYIKARQEEVSQAKKIIIRESNPPLGGVYDIRDSLQQVEKNIVLDGEELLYILNTLITGHRLNNYFFNLDDDENEYYRIIKIAGQIGNFKDLERKIKRTINDQGKVKDTASSKLGDIRSDLRRTGDQIREKLNSIINSSRHQKHIQDTVVTIRDGRYVIPIKTEYQNKFPGLVHDQSASGQTLFIEPISVVKLNNKMRQLESQEEQEVYRILQELSFKIKERINEIKDTIQILAILDFIFAKARYSIKLDGVEPILNKTGYINLIKARHPLLTEDVVPIDIYLGGKFNTLVVTGPNTGGKTVTLKTVGVLIIMAQAGLHIPALSGSEIGIYSKLYADIGDEQSIEQNLSTFSSHMNQIINIIKQVDEDSLVLLDEVGAGTDPAEGASLAMSILNHLHQIGVKTIATTHYSQLKTYAYGREGVENASVEFDVETLQPTYRLQMGLPGRSNAFEIARKLGLKDEIITKAGQLLNEEDVEFDEIIKEIEKDKQEYTINKQKSKKIKEEAQKLKEEYEVRLEDLKEERDKELKETYREAKKIIKRAQMKADKIIKDLKEKKVVSDREIEKAKSGLREERKNINQGQGQLVEEIRESHEIPNLKVGDRVKIKSVNKKGEVIQLSEEEAVVQAGIMRVTVDLRELTKVEEDEDKRGKTNASRVKMNKSKSISPKLDLRGLRAEESKRKLEKYLDSVMLANLNQIKIVHGKGTGVLRKVVHQAIDNYPGVKEYRLGRPKEGGTGVTFVNF